MKDIKKKLVKQVKRSRPSLAQEIKDMSMKDFRALWFVVQAQGALRLITSEPTWANNDFTNLLHREIIKRGQIRSYIIL